MQQVNKAPQNTSYCILFISISKYHFLITRYFRTATTKRTVMAAADDDILTDILPLKDIAISDMIQMS